MKRSSPLRLLALPATALLICGLALNAGAASAATNLLANPGFETGTLSGWTCSSTDGVTASPVHSGSHALAGAASNSDDAQCSQQVSVQPSSSYTLSGWVEATTCSSVTPAPGPPKPTTGPRPRRAGSSCPPRSPPGRPRPA